MVMLSGGVFCHIYPTGGQIVSYGDSRLILWNVKTSKKVKELRTRSKSIDYNAFLARGKCWCISDEAGGVIYME